MTTFESCRLRIDPPTGRITLSKPPLNVLDLAGLEELHHVLDEVEAASGVASLVLSAEGERAFSAGVEVRDHLPDRLDEMIEVFHRLCRRFLGLDAVTIAAVRGAALGGAMELLSCCDFVVASKDSVFGQPEIELACFPPLGCAIYPALLGKARAHRIALLGERFSAAEAEAIGFLYRAVSPADVDAEVEELLKKLSEKSPAALRLAKRALRISTERALEALPEIETLYREELAVTEDMREGLQAFLEKRKPEWKGT
jgi:cyclohexa-1,5-dienecarbonyl-CoA hydratase